MEFVSLSLSTVLKHRSGPEDFDVDNVQRRELINFLRGIALYKSYYDYYNYYNDVHCIGWS